LRTVDVSHRSSWPWSAAALVFFLSCGWFARLAWVVGRRAIALRYPAPANASPLEAPSAISEPAFHTLMCTAAQLSAAGTIAFSLGVILGLVAFVGRPRSVPAVLLGTVLVSWALLMSVLP
jgi:hypothetical protein